MKEDLLDKYAFNKLTKEDLALLDELLTNEPDFQKELDLHAEVVQGMAFYMNKSSVPSINEKNLKQIIQKVDIELEEEGFFNNTEEKGQENSSIIKGIQLAGEKELQNTISLIDKELEKDGFFNEENQNSTVQQKETPILSLVQKFLVAASVLLVLTLGWQFMGSNNSMSATEEYANLFTPVNNQLTKTVQLELSEQGFAGNPEKEHLEQVIIAMEAYDAQNYTQCIKLLNATSNQLDENYQVSIQLYLAISYMAANDLDAAIILLKELENSTLHKEDAIWYLALAQLKAENIGLCKNYLVQLKHSPKYQTKVKELLEKL